MRLLEGKGKRLVSLLTAGHHYFGERAQRFVFDPRYLVFEYSNGIVLSKRQCDLVSEMFTTVNQGQQSCVHQMIMVSPRRGTYRPFICRRACPW